MTEALRLRKLGLQLFPPVAVERSPSEQIFVQHLPKQHLFHRDVAPTVEDRTGLPFRNPLPLADLSELSCLEEVHPVQHLAPARSGTASRVSAEAVMTGSIVLGYGR